METASLGDGPGGPTPQRLSSREDCLHLDPVGLARSPAGRVDGDGMNALTRVWTPRCRTTPESSNAAD
jgi:hypothetical protein